VELVYEPVDGPPRTVVARVELADTVLSRARGFVGRRPPADLALVMRFPGQRRHSLHMVGVPVALDAAWVCDGVVQRVARLRPWLGFGSGVADTVVECRAGTLAGVEAGDRLVVADGSTGDDADAPTGSDGDDSDGRE